MPDQQLSDGSTEPRHREKRIARFGAYEFRPDTQELLKEGVRVKIQTKPLQILKALVDRPGELVTRDELCRELWPHGTFVDFDSGLNTATNRLRAALNDCPEHPVYIETLPRLGYRFVCPVIYDSANRTTSECDVTTPLQVAAAVELKPLEFAAPTREAKHRAVLLITIGVVAAGLCVVGIARKMRTHTTFWPVTYREQAIRSARFAQGSNTAVFTAYTLSQGVQTYRANVNGGNTQPVAVSEGQLASVSQSGDLLIQLNPPDSKHVELLRIGPNGERTELGANAFGSMELLPGGNSIVRSRNIDSDFGIEFPAGHLVYQSPAWFTDLRLSPDGKKVALIEHPVRDDDCGHVRVVDKNGMTKVLTADWNSAQGLAWAPTGNEIWFTASEASAVRSLFAVSLSGLVRRVTGTPTSLHLFDISPNWRVLLSVDNVQNAMVAEFPGSNNEKDVTEFDLPTVEAISRDGQRLLFTESGDAGGQHYSASLFDNKQHRSHVFARGRALALSPSEQFALAIDPKNTTELTSVQLQTGSASRIFGHGIRYQWARFLSESILLVGGSSGSGALTLFRQSALGGNPVPMKGYPYLDHPVVSSGGNKVAGWSEGKVTIIDFCKRSTKQLPLKEMMVPVAWSGDESKLFLATWSGPSPAIFEYDLAGQALVKWKQLRTSGSASGGDIGGVVAAPDAGAYAYSLRQDLSRLYVVDGLS